jgi:hypothetical protein
VHTPTETTIYKHFIILAILGLCLKKDIKSFEAQALFDKGFFGCFDGI